MTLSLIRKQLKVFFLAASLCVWDPRSLTRDGTRASALEGRILTTGPPGNPTNEGPDVVLGGNTNSTELSPDVFISKGMYDRTPGGSRDLQDQSTSQKGCSKYRAGCSSGVTALPQTPRLLLPRDLMNESPRSVGIVIPSHQEGNWGTARSLGPAHSPHIACRGIMFSCLIPSLSHRHLDMGGGVAGC